MGGSKRLLADQEAQHSRALKLLADAGAIHFCPDHEEVWIDSEDRDALEEALAEAEGDAQPGVASLQAQVRQVYAEAAYECPFCASRR